MKYILHFKRKFLDALSNLHQSLTFVSYTDIIEEQIRPFPYYAKRSSHEEWRQGQVLADNLGHRPFLARSKPPIKSGTILLAGNLNFFDDRSKYDASVYLVLYPLLVGLKTCCDQFINGLLTVTTERVVYDLVEEEEGASVGSGPNKGVPGRRRNYNLLSLLTNFIDSINLINAWAGCPCR